MTACKCVKCIVVTLIEFAIDVDESVAPPQTACQTEIRIEYVNDFKIVPTNSIT